MWFSQLVPGKQPAEARVLRCSLVLPRDPHWCLASSHAVQASGVYLEGGLAWQFLPYEMALSFLLFVI